MSKNNPATAPTAALKTQIVVVGGGAGGLELVRSSARISGASATTSSWSKRNRTHIWKPLLHEVAAARWTPISTRSAIAATAIAGAIASFYGALEGIDRETRQMSVAPILDEDGSEIIGRHRIRYDYLVLAVGSVTNDFGTRACASIACSSTTARGPTVSATSCSTIACACRAR